LPPLFVLVMVTILGSGAQYVWVWGRKAMESRRSRPVAGHR
jgi:cytochrome c oxidase subunit IV